MESLRFVLLLVFLTSLTVFLGDARSAKSSESGCKLPRCRCWNTPYRPGNMVKEYTPQMVILAFAEAMNTHTVSQYLPIFDFLYNPNDCPAKGTFFVQDIDSDRLSLRTLYMYDHEIALTTSNTSVPKTSRKWTESLLKSYERVLDAEIPRSALNGVMAPSLYMGGDEEMFALEMFGMKYEASCVLPVTSKTQQMLWPYTYDCKDRPRCVLGRTPNNTFEEVWQFVMPEIRYKGHTCTILSSCSPYLNTTSDVYRLLYGMFIEHYYESRAPLVLYIDPLWLSRDSQKQGLKQFLKGLNSFENTWIITMSQALEWIKHPVPMYNGVRFEPWECDQTVKRRR